MPPRSTLGITTPLPDHAFHRTPDEWLNDRRKVDDTGGLWRIHDGLYDFTSFIKKHPGGQFWLEQTKGMDISEAFESHHISTVPEGMLKNYFVKKTDTPRSFPFTFRDDGFYRTVKKNVREVLKTLPKDPVKLSNKLIDTFIGGMLVFALLATLFWNFTFGIISAIFFGLTAVASHNYTHQKDNFRMYYSDICMQDSREWRVMHTLSHHMFPNTVADMQVYLAEPIIQFFPHTKPFVVKYGSIIYQPLLIWTVILPILSLMKVYKLLSVFRGKMINFMDFLPFFLPLAMCLLGGQSILWTLLMWEFIISIGGFTYTALSFTAGHFHPDVFIDGDKARPVEERDWGISQLDSVADRNEITGNHFLVLISFGDHALHHLFPTLDHGLLNQLYPVIQETAKQFNLNIKMMSLFDVALGYFRQIAREVPNPNPPGFKK